MASNRSVRQMRCIPGKFSVRAEGDVLKIEGYFAVFGATYQLWEDATESIAPGTFSETLGEDVRALIDHETRLVLGRNKAGTLELKEDSYGLWGSVTINPNDVDAMSLYARVQRGDVDQCSFGFDILDEEFTNDGSKIHWTIKKVKLYEVSVVTFPAYEETGVTARKQQLQEIEKRHMEHWRKLTMQKLKGES